MNELYFNCHQCGRCCDGPPAIFLSEVLHQSQKFILELNLFKNSIPNQTNKDHLYQLMGLDIQICVNATDYPSLAHCAYLKNKLCSIYSERPQMCQMVPLKPYLPNSFIESPAYDKTVGLFLAEGCLSREAKPGMTKIYASGVIHNIESSVIKQRADADAKFYLPMIKELGDFIEGQVKFSATFVRNQAAVVRLSICSLLLHMYNFDFMSDADLKIILDNQIKLIEAKVELALQRKNKLDRETTQILRHYLNEYQNMSLNLSAQSEE